MDHIFEFIKFIYTIIENKNILHVFANEFCEFKISGWPRPARKNIGLAWPGPLKVHRPGQARPVVGRPRPGQAGLEGRPAHL